MCIVLVSCTNPKEEINASKEYTGGIWITHRELDNMLSVKSEFKTKFATVLDNCLSINISDIYIHVRAFCDSIYKSNYFPSTKASGGYEYDVFEYIISECHSRGIRVHAWINPYRVSNTSGDINSISEQSPVFRWLNDDDMENDKNVSLLKNGIYLNPAESEVRALIIDGIREIIQNYKVDGIHFDDYFYPTKAEEFDKESFNLYDGGLSLDDWRRANVNSLIGGCYTAIKFTDKNIVFSISPAASIEKNYTDLYADVAAWMSSGCVDYIIPQIYFGFNYPLEECRYLNLVNEWQEFSSDNGNVLIVIGLAAYKIGSEDEADSEWSEYDDILARQIEICKNNGNIIGHCFFSYSSLFSENEHNKAQLKNIKEKI